MTHQKRHYDLDARPTYYQEGDVVWLHRVVGKKGRSPKLIRPWTGPYLVIQRISGVTYRIQASPRGKTQIVHADRLKKCHGVVAKDLGFGSDPVDAAPLPPAPTEELRDVPTEESPSQEPEIETKGEEEGELEPPSEKDALPQREPRRTRRGRVSRPPQRLGIDD